MGGLGIKAAIDPNLGSRLRRSTSCRFRWTVFVLIIQIGSSPRCRHECYHLLSSPQAIINLVEVRSAEHIYRNVEEVW